MASFSQAPHSSKQAQKEEPPTLMALGVNGKLSRPGAVAALGHYRLRGLAGATSDWALLDSPPPTSAKSE